MTTTPLTDLAEEWLPVTIFPGYDGYEVSNLGKIRCHNPRNRNAWAPDEPRLLRPNTKSTGHYPAIVMYGQGMPRQVKVHKIVCHEFLGPQPAGSDILHLDDNPSNNKLSNLRYGTRKENSFDKMVNQKSDSLLKNVDELAHYCHTVAEIKGFWDYEPSPDLYLAKMALIHSEVSEILEAYRKEKGVEKLTEEFADVLIRLIDLWSAMSEEGLVGSFRDSVLEKIHVNRDRPVKHGNLI